MSAIAKIAESHQPVNRHEIERFFAGVNAQIGKAKTFVVQDPSLAAGMADVGSFFSVIKHKVEPRRRLLNRRQATGFNVFHFIEPDENKFSDVLAWLLKPQESHGQGDTFLRLLFKRLDLDSNANLTTNATVQREAPTFGIEKFRRRMDVLVKAGAWLVIENKLDSSEQLEQVKDYLEHLHRCSGKGNSKSALIYLTPNGRSPKSLGVTERKEHEDCGQLHCWSYQNELVGWLEDCRRGCKAQRIKIFLTDIISYIQSKLKRETEKKPERDENDN